MRTQTIKIWKGTLKKLRMLYALTGKSMVEILDCLVARELERIQQEGVAPSILADERSEPSDKHGCEP